MVTTTSTKEARLELDPQGFRDYMMTRVVQHSLSALTVTTYMGALLQFFSWVRNTNASELTRELCQQYIDSLTIKGKSNSTVSVAAHAIKRYLRFKGLHFDLEYPSIELSKPKYISVEQVEIMLDECRTPLENALVRLLFDTGARISEITNIQMKDIDWQKKIITVTRKGGHHGDIIMSTETTDAVAELIVHRKGIGDNLFLDKEAQDLSRILRKLGRKAGFFLSPHMMRHARAIQMIEAGAEIWTVQQVLGHLDIRTTMNIYSRFKPEHLREHIPDMLARSKIKEEKHE